VSQILCLTNEPLAFVNATLASGWKYGRMHECGREWGRTE
jgi:hypothetical protein